MTNLLDQIEVKQNTISLKEEDSCASVLVKTLLKLGATEVFGYPGASVLSIYNELSKIKEITHYLVRHEQAAVHAAEGYARVSGKCGVVLVTSGPGFTNTITGISNAYADSTPLVVLAGDVSTSKNNTKIFQNVDIVSLSKSCAKKVIMLTQKDDIVQVIEEAFEVAMSGVKGPVVVALPRNLLEKKYVSQKKYLTIKPENQRLSQKSLKDILLQIKNSKSPLLLIGGGAINASLEIIEFSVKYNIPVISTLMGIGVFPSDNSLYLGMIGINGTRLANLALNQSDLVISLGVSFSDRTTCKNECLGKNAQVLNINIRKTKNNNYQNIIIDSKVFVSQLLELEAEIPVKATWLNMLSLLKSEVKTENNMTSSLHSSYVLDILSKYTEKYEPIVVTDVGQHQMLTAQYFSFNKPNKFITSGGMGTMGFGLPAAIGAHIANRNNMVLNITGDGSFQMNLQELATCREHQIPLKIIILNNSYLGMVRQLQEKIYGSRYQVEMINPDFTKIAEAYDLFAVRVASKEDLLAALDKAFAYEGTAIIDILIDSFENI